MIQNKFENIINSFALKNMMVLSDLERIEKEFDIILFAEKKVSAEIEQDYFPQFDEKLRKEASRMTKYYEVFYCLENTIRGLITDIMDNAFGINWWDSTHIPSQTIGEVKKRIKHEKDAGITTRSNNDIDYTTFGELADIIKMNWSEFGAIFNSQKAVERIMFNLNTLRNNIAHSCPLSEDEVVRLELSVRDWFRIMEL